MLKELILSVELRFPTVPAVGCFQKQYLLFLFNLRNTIVCSVFMSINFTMNANRNCLSPFIYCLHTTLISFEDDSRLHKKNKQNEKK
jgi:hypothetical protein